MSHFRLGPTKIAEWYALVIEAQNECGHDFDESLQQYLVMTLDHFTTQDKLVTAVIAFDYLQSLNMSGKLGGSLLRNVGDQCLIISGLFPERALRKNISLNYFISIGQQVYDSLALTNPNFEFDAELFAKLSTNFVGLMDVLHTMRQLPDPIIQ